MPFIIKGLLCVWALFLVGLIAQLSVGHAALPGPSVVQAPAGSANSQLQMLHVLAPGCVCSQRVATYLQTREPQNHEHVIIVGEDPALESALKRYGWTVSTNADEAARWGIHGGPWLLIHDANHQIRYSGGYGPAQSPLTANGYHDQDIYLHLTQGKATTPYPSYGCATSVELQRTRTLSGWLK